MSEREPLKPRTPATPTLGERAPLAPRTPVAASSYGEYNIQNEEDGKVGLMDPSIAQTRNGVFKAMVGGSVALITFMLVMCLLYLGSVWDPTGRWGNLDILVINNDVPAGNIYIGGVMLKVLQNNPEFTYHFRPPPWEDATFERAKQLIDDGTYWGAFYIPATASKSLNASLFGGVKPYYNPITYFIDEGRQATQTAIINGHLRQKILIANSIVANGILQMMSRGARVNLTNIDLSAVYNPIQGVQYNLHPASLYGLTFATFFGNIIMFIMASSQVNVVGMLTSKLQDKVKTSTLAVVKVAYSLVNGFLLSLTWALLILCFNGGTQTSSASQTPLVITDGHDFNFAALWFFGYLVIMTFTSINIFVSSTFGPPGQIANTIFMVLQVTTSDGMLPRHVMPDFFRIGPGLPMYHAVTGSKTILFGCYDETSEHLGVLFAWCIGCYILTYFSVHFKWGKLIDKATPEFTKTLTQSMAGGSNEVGLAVPIIF